MSVRHALLALLSEGPKYGLQLRQEFEARTGEVWPLNVGQVYTTLQRLERDGLVESDDADDEGPQKGFRITDDGHGSWTAGCGRRPTSAPPPRDELVIKVLVAVRVPGVDVHEVIQVHRRHLVELMQQLHPPQGRRRRATTSRWRWWSTPSCSGSTASCGGSTPPTPGWRRPAWPPDPAAAGREPATCADAAEADA